MTWFGEWVQSHAPDWVEATRKPGKRSGDADEVWRTFPSPLPSEAGFRIVWVHSSGKAVNDAASRAARIEAGVAALDDLASKLAGRARVCAPEWPLRRPRHGR